MKNRSLILIAISLFVSCTQEREKTFEIGQKSVIFTDESRNRPLLTEIWYPTLDTLTKGKPKVNQNQLFKTIETIPNATIADEKFPLLLISHGTGGNRFSLTWFVEKMIKEGYIVVSLDHYGNSTFNKVPREFVKWWERAIDVQFVLTKVLSDDQIGNRIDTSRIGGVGFSLGGYTNIALAGGYVDRRLKRNEGDKNRELPAEFPKTDEVIDFEKDSLIVSSYLKYKNNVKDERMKAFFTMAPAIGFGFHSTEQTNKITAPILIVAGKGDIVAPVKHNTEIYHRLIKTSEIHLFDENVGHYVFLNEPTKFGKKVAPKITIDNPNVNRKEIHKRTLELAIKFFRENL